MLEGAFERVRDRFGGEEGRTGGRKREGSGEMEGPREGEGALLLVVTEGEAGGGRNEADMFGAVGWDVLGR